MKKILVYVILFLCPLQLFGQLSEQENFRLKMYAYLVGFAEANKQTLFKISTSGLNETSKSLCYECLTDTYLQRGQELKCGFGMEPREFIDCMVAKTVKPDENRSVASENLIVELTQKATACLQARQSGN